jgi:biotin operon repressor
MERVVNYITIHGSKEKPVSNMEIGSQLKLSEQIIRKKINEARCNGIPICSCVKGYYYSEDKSEILATIQSLMHRTIAVEKAVNGLLTVVRCEMEGSEHE